MYLKYVGSADIICYKLTSLVSLQQVNVKKSGKLMKIANIDREILHNFWTTWGISMKFSGKMRLMIILKVTKSQGFTLSLEDTFFEKPQEGVGQTDHLAVLGLRNPACLLNIWEISSLSYY